MHRKTFSDFVPMYFEKSLILQQKNDEILCAHCKKHYIAKSCKKYEILLCTSFYNLSDRFINVFYTQKKSLTKRSPKKYMKPHLVTILFMLQNMTIAYVFSSPIKSFCADCYTTSGAFGRGMSKKDDKKLT